MQSTLLVISLVLTGACPCENPRPTWQMPYYQTPCCQSFSRCSPCCDECDECCVCYEPTFETKCVQPTVSREELAPSSTVIIPAAQIRNISGVNAVKLRDKMLDTLKLMNLTPNAKPVRGNQVEITTGTVNNERHQIIADISADNQHITITVKSRGTNITPEVPASVTTDLQRRLTH